MKVSTSNTFPPPPCQEMFAWNMFHIQDLLGFLGDTESSFWALHIIHGAFLQRRIHVLGLQVDVVLIARRSRHYAGTRYLKRGVSDQGKVGNDVEVEEVLQVFGLGVGTKYSSLVQHRGSIPVFWNQETSLTQPKPPINLHRLDPSYTATCQHFYDLFSRYSSPLIVLDLVKLYEKREREVIIGRELKNAVDALNSMIHEKEHQIRYCAMDFSRLSKNRSVNVLEELDQLALWALHETWFFCSFPVKDIDIEGNIITLSDDEKDQRESSFQKGVLRTNCVDCLDRTNVAQFTVALRYTA